MMPLIRQAYKTFIDFFARGKKLEMHLSDQSSQPDERRDEVDHAVKTLSNKYCVAVFEGGGVKGAAYIGALKACEDGGICFVGACGTSAGSIAAALN